MIFFFIDYLERGTYSKVGTDLHSVWVFA